MQDCDRAVCAALAVDKTGVVFVASAPFRYPTEKGKGDMAKIDPEALSIEELATGRQSGLRVSA